MKKTNIIAMALIALFLSCGIHAAEFDQPLIGSVIVHSQADNYASYSAYAPTQVRKNVVLMNIKLTQQQRRTLSEFSTTDDTANEKTSSKTLKQFDLGMNGVPVLDQGMHGACVTFAVTAAIDAMLGKGDYISQLCNLELGSYLENYAYLPSGWNGTLAAMVLNQIKGFGIINNDNQRANACGPLRAYPVDDRRNMGTPLSLEEYKKASENIGEHIYWEPLLTRQQRFHWKSESEGDLLLSNIKRLISSRKDSTIDLRIVLAIQLPVTLCGSGACGRYHVTEDTWVISKEIIQNRGTYLGGHAMVITGYDDDAIAVDRDGATHRGLLILRNSWGVDAGDRGNYYMSYSFFKHFVTEVEAIVFSKD